MMKTIKPFIDLKWHTVPLNGKLLRKSNGKKTIPKFPEDWKATYTETFNTVESELGGAITGKVSGIIAIDCDNTATYNVLKSLDPDYKFHFVSKGKKNAEGIEQVCATIIYKYVEELSESFTVHNNQFDLDFLSNERFTYLPTEANKTKDTFSLEGKELKEPSAEIIALLKTIKPVEIRVDEQVLKDKEWKNHLGPQVQKFVDSKQLIPELFKVITPKAYRSQAEYVEKGFLHPDEIPEGAGSDYLSKVSAILGADESIDEELYVKAIKLVNDLFSKPMPSSRLQTTIIEPMVEEKASVNGEVIWRYNENWADYKLLAVTKRNELLEGFFDPNRSSYYLADVSNSVLKSFSKDTDFFQYLEAVVAEPPSKKEAKARAPLVDVTSSPAYDFGFYTSNDRQAFNRFKPTPALSIFRNPEIYKDKYSRPNTILNYLESLVPDNYMRNYLLKFLRRKLDKFEYSPAILYFLGASGAGKDTLVSLIECIIGSDGVGRPSSKEFLEIYNGWIVDRYFVQLDEYGNQLVKYDDKESALGLIKAYTGKQKVEIRQMRTDGYPYVHNVTFIMTANKNPLMLDADDRRVALFNCPNDLKAETWVQQAGGMGVVYDRIFTEVHDFAYYLATEVDNASKDEYMAPPETADKKRLIVSKFDASKKLAFMFKHEMWDELDKLSKEYEAPELLENAAEGKVYEEELFDMYYEMTDGKGTKRGLTLAMKEFDKIPTTRNGSKAYYFNVPNLRNFKFTAFNPINEDDIE